MSLGLTSREDAEGSLFNHLESAFSPSGQIRSCPLKSVYYHRRKHSHGQNHVAPATLKLSINRIYRNSARFQENLTSR